MASLLKCKISQVLIHNYHCRIDHNKGYGGFKSSLNWWLFDKSTQVAEHYLNDVSMGDLAKTKVGDAIIKKKVAPIIQGIYAIQSLFCI
jgi:protoporphyrinogen oxidase